jgi:FAD/FMN-containing dehydrogenase
MNRREFLKRAAVMPALPTLAPLLGAAAAPAAFRRTRPTDPGWPSGDAWARLGEQVGGRLVPVPSLLAPCTGPGSAGNAACATRIAELANPYFIGEQPGGTQTSGWLDAWTSAPSVYAVAASKTSDVVAAVNFARENRLRLVVKGGGHSYQGTSNAPDSLLVWTRAMSAITLHDAFVPQGCTSPARPAVTVEAGARWLPTYDAVTTGAGRYVQGGGCATVGVAGLIQSGGFGSFSKNFGLAAAGLLEAEVVTADGKVRVVNACTHSELFWGLKGGGGGSLGVVTRVTLATHPLPRSFGWAEATIQAKSDAAFRRLLTEFVRFYERALMNPHWGEQATLGSDNTLDIRMVSSGLETTEASAAWKPFSDFVASSPEDFAFSDELSVGTMPARHWWDPEWRRKNDPDSVVADPRSGAPAGNVWWAGNSIEVNVYLYGYESLWLPASLLAEPDRLAGALFAATRKFAVGLHFNKGLAGAPLQRVAEARDTATNPAALDSFALAIIATGKPHSAPGLPGHEPDPVEGRRQAAAVAAAADALRTVVPNGGAYLSESNYFDRSFQKSYWGSNYPRLQQVKKRYDPEGLFFVHNGVGSEGWSADGFTRLT